jgi:hypothetical protein
MMNDETEPFERRLSRQPLRQVPHEWRAEILLAARDVQPACHSSPVTRHSLPSTLVSRLSTIFWPHPKAWAGLAAVWVFIFALNFSMRDKSPVVAEKISPPSPEVMVELKKQQRMFAELMGANEPAQDADRRKILSPKPRSKCVEILMT